jgi:cellulose synthase/poly-beta-1,6-N-acetylglucosamine synthase-like glycosyltransferase
VFCAQCLAALLPGRSSSRSNGSADTSTTTADPRPRVAVLMPAHNEQETLGATLDAVRPQLRDGDALQVVADNCDDDTAAIARATARPSSSALTPTIAARDTPQPRLGGAEGERVRRPDRPRRRLPCRGGLDRRARRQVARTGKPAQAVYLMEACDEPTPRDHVSSWAFMVKNLVRPMGLHRFGMPVPLTGTGMAFPRAALEKVSLAGGNIVEDMQLGLDLAMAGEAPRLCAEARVTGRFPRDGSIALGQRRRWEHGHLRTIIGRFRGSCGAA